MTLAINCPHCDKPLQLPSRLAGRRVRCAACNEEFLASKEDVREVGEEEPPARDSGPRRRPARREAPGPKAGDIRVSCSKCRRELTFSADLAGVTVCCPHESCKAWLDLPENKEPDSPSPEQEIAEGYGDRAKKFAENEEDPSELAGRRRRNRRANRERREGLRKVNVGLMFHSAALLLFLAGMAFGVFSCGFLLPVSILLMAAAAAVNLPFPILCLLGPATTVRWPLIVSLVLAAPPMGLAALFFLIGMASGGHAGHIVLALLLPALTFMATHYLWLLYIKDLAEHLERPEISYAVLDLVGAEVKYLVFMPILSGLSVMLFLVHPCGAIFVICSFAAFFIRTSSLEWWEVLLYPTGIPLLIKYYNLLATLRYVLMRFI